MFQNCDRSAFSYLLSLYGSSRVYSATFRTAGGASLRLTGELVWQLMWWQRRALQSLPE